MIKNGVAYVAGVIFKRISLKTLVKTANYNSNRPHVIRYIQKDPVIMAKIIKIWTRAHNKIALAKVYM